MYLTRYFNQLKKLPIHIFLLGMFALASLPVFAQEASTSAATTPAATKNTSYQPAELPLEKLRLFAEIYQQIKEAYVEEVSDEQLLEAAIKGMLNGLDPHSAYLSAEDYQELKENTEGEFVGLGLEIGKGETYIEVIAPLDDSPAAQAGIQAGDLILKINNLSTFQLSLEEARNLLRGKENTEVELSLKRNQLAEPLTIKLKRSKIKLASVKQELLEENLGYLRLSQFQKQTAKEALKAINQLKQQNKQPLQGLILDLRNNPGGVLDAAAEVADLFIQDGLLVYTQGRLENSYMEFKTLTQDDVLAGAPLIVLINSGSASAAEIVAGALQDHQRALILGTSSFGKGSVQSLAPLPSGKGLKLTTALYYTPNGRSIQAEGIEPDIYLAEGEISLAPVSERTKEANLSRHLAQPKATKKPSSATAATRLNLQQDYQLFSAVNLLKGLVLQAKNN